VKETTRGNHTGFNGGWRRYTKARY
jgi:hypothetical protein